MDKHFMTIVIILVLYNVTVYGQERDNSVCNTLPYGSEGNGNVPGGRCDTFITCWNYTNVAEMTCGGDTYFNPDTGDCDLDPALCDSVPKNRGSDCKTVANTFDCSVFTLCVTSTLSYQLRCPLGTMFHNVYRVCVYPSFALAKAQLCSYIGPLSFE